MDDSRLLCLSSAERLKIKDSLKLIFETTDLSQATPSTVSRCGILYCEEQLIEFENIVRVYIDRELKGIIQQEYIEHVKKWIVIACSKGFPYLNKMCKMQVKQTNSHLALQIAKLAKILIQSEKNLDVLDERGESWSKRAFEKLVMFAYYWGVGTMVKFESMPRFERQMGDIFPSGVFEPRVSQLYF